MTHEVLVARIPHVCSKHGADRNDFKALVSAHHDELVKHEAHMMMVRTGNAQAYPPPTAHPEVDNAIRRVVNPDGSIYYDIDYEVVDYLTVAPGDEAALDQRKAQLTQELSFMEEQSLGKVLPARKWKLVNLQYVAAKAKAESDLTDADKQTIADHETRITQCKAIQLFYAQQLSEVEDLNFDSVNGFRPAAYAG